MSGTLPATASVATMETEDPMETYELGRSNTHQVGHCGDDDSDIGSGLLFWFKSQFWYEVQGCRNIPDYRFVRYPWEEKEEKKKGIHYFLEVTDKSWPDATEEERKRGRWSVEKRMLKRKEIDASPHPEEVVDTESSSVCTDAEVLDVRVEMHECMEDGVSCGRLFKSEANMEELHYFDSVQRSYLMYVSRLQCENSDMRSYAHIFPKIWGAPVSVGWVKPTTLEGDRQYLSFFRMLKDLAKYGQSKDDVTAQAIVLARKFFSKILYFQIDIAVKDVRELLENEERMQQRYSLYYFAAREIILNGKDCKTVLKSIRDGDSWLPYDLTEFNSFKFNPDGLIADTLDYLVSRLHAEREGFSDEWLFDSINDQVVQIVYEVVDDQLGFQSNLYVDFLRRKMNVAKDRGLLPPEDTPL